VLRPRFRKVAVLVFDGAPLFETSVPLSVFGIDRTSTGAPRFDCWAVAGTSGPVRTTTGVRLGVDGRLDSLREAEVIVVPTWRHPDDPPPRRTLDALAAAHAAGSTVVGLCLGAFVLAAAGLLDGRRAATHWLYADTLAARHPDVQVDPAVLFVDEGDVLTSAGTAAGLDACLHLVRSAYGARSAAAIARRMVVAPQRVGGQAQFIDQPLPTHDPTNGLAAVLDDALGRLAEEITVDDLAARAHMSRRSFDRHFRVVTGTSPHQWLLHQRILAAQRLLEDTDLPVDDVAAAAGFGAGVSMRPHFRRAVGVSPQTYRATFRPAEPAASTGVQPAGGRGK
jgi:transcriptional regulator GlxA family with amidase domain